MRELGKNVHVVGWLGLGAGGVGGGGTGFFCVCVCVCVLFCFCFVYLLLHSIGFILFIAKVRSEPLARTPET